MDIVPIWADASTGASIGLISVDVSERDCVLRGTLRRWPRDGELITTSGC